MTIKHTHQVAYDYCQALRLQRAYEQQLDVALQLLNPDNQVFGLADAVEGAYTNLVEQLLGPELWEWLMWWMYETEHGQVNSKFIINNQQHDPTTMTLYKFLELVDQ